MSEFKTYELSTSLDHLHCETTSWTRKLRFYRDELVVWRVMLKRKCPSGCIVSQVKKDLQLNIHTMRRLVSKVLLKELREHERQLSALFLVPQNSDDISMLYEHQNFHQKIEKLDRHFDDLKVRLYRFLKNNHPQQRHGFYK